MAFLHDIVTVTRFKKFAHELTTIEFSQLISKFTEKYDKEVILKLFVSGIIKPKSVDITQILENMMQIISDIIQSRDQKSKSIQDTNTMKIDQITSSLIGEIGSYLHQTSYSSFACTNRTIFVSLNQPNTLQMLSLKSVDDYSCIHLQNYPQIKSLSFRLYEFNRFEIPRNRTVCNQLKTMFLLPDVNILRIPNMLPFIEQQNINLNNMQTLSIGHNNTVLALAGRELYDLLSRFSMIQHLQLLQIGSNDPAALQRRELAFPNLKRLTVCSCTGATLTLVVHLLQKYGSSLECLLLRERSGSPLDLDNENIDFTNMKKLGTFGVTSNTLDCILKTAKNLNQICFHTTTLKKQKIQYAIKKMIKEQSKLEYINIATRHNKLSAICNVLESSLFSIRKQERGVFEISMQFTDENVMDVDDIIVKISRIVNRLSTSNIGKFTLKCWWPRCKGDVLKLLFNTVQDLFDCTQAVTQLQIKNNGFIIQNEKYAVIGEKLWWQQYLQYVWK